MTARSSATLKAQFVEKDGYDRYVDTVDSFLNPQDSVTFDAAVAVGTFASSTAGSGIAMSASDSVGLGVYVDDNGAAIGSGTLTRAIRGRNLQTYTSGNREQEAAGVIGQINSVGGTNRHNMAGVWGSYELSGSSNLIVDGQAATTDTWIQAAVLGRVGVGSSKTTINSNGVLAGVAAMQNTAALTANNGVFTAFYVGAWGSMQNWSHGLYIQHNAVDCAIQIGELSSTSQTGFHLTSTNNNVIDSFADDNNTTLGDAVYSNIRARTMLFKACTAGTIISLKGQLKLYDEADLGPGVFAGVQGYLELATDADVKSGGKVWAIDASIEAPSGGTLTVDSGGLCAGLHAELTGSGTVSSSGTLAGLYVDEQVTSGDWDYGIYIASGKRAFYSTTTLSGSAALNAVDIEVTDTTTNSSGYARGLYVNATVTGDKTGTGEHNTVGVDLAPTGDAYIATPLSMYTGSCGDAVISNLWGSFLYMDDIGGSATVTTKYGHAIGIDNGDNATTCAFFRLYNHGSASNDIDYIFDMPNAGISAAQYFFHVGTTGTMIEAGDVTSGKSCTNGLRVLVGSTVKVIALYED